MTSSTGHRRKQFPSAAIKSAALFLLVCLALGAPVSIPAAAQNLLVNGDMEQAADTVGGLAGWSSYRWEGDATVTQTAQASYE